MNRNHPESIAELKALQAQITPHFLYNTLSLINGMAIQSGELSISRLTKNISNFYRTVLNDGRNVTTVRGEIDNTRTYISIQLVMHNESFDVEYDLMPEIFDFEMINLVLQPLVENAIEHGLDQIRNRRGLLRITGRVEDECLEFTVHNTGPSVSAERFQKILRTDSSRYGLKNVNERIKIMCGDDYGLRMINEESSGFSIQVDLPCHVSERGRRSSLV